MKVLELFDGIKVEVYSNGKIKTLTHNTIRSNGRLDNRCGKILKPVKDRYGYLKIVISKGKKRKTYLVHRLVALAYIPNPQNKPTVNHINGIKTDNNVSNLEWATYKEQKEHAIKNNLCELNIKSLENANKNRSIKIIYNGVLYNSIREASRITGICQWSIKHHGTEVVNYE